MSREACRVQACGDSSARWMDGVLLPTSKRQNVLRFSPAQFQDAIGTSVQPGSPLVPCGAISCARMHLSPCPCRFQPKGSGLGLNWRLLIIPKAWSWSQDVFVGLRWRLNLSRVLSPVSCPMSIPDWSFSFPFQCCSRENAVGEGKGEREGGRQGGREEASRESSHTL